jgi:hypothetical protein
MMIIMMNQPTACQVIGNRCIVFGAYLLSVLSVEIKAWHGGAIDTEVAMSSAASSINPACLVMLYVLGGKMQVGLMAVVVCIGIAVISTVYVTGIHNIVSVALKVCRCTFSPYVRIPGLQVNYYIG